VSILYKIFTLFIAQESKAMSILVCSQCDVNKPDIAVIMKHNKRLPEMIVA
jgi:hypothetical protein